MRKWIYDVSEGITVDFNEIKAVKADGVLIDGTWVELSKEAIREIDNLIDAEKRLAEAKDKLN